MAIKLAKEALEALDNLDAIPLENNKIEESLFVKKYLPLFLVENAPRLGVWSNVAGSPYRPVDIVRNGEKVGEVPPLLLDIPLTERNGYNSLYEHITSAFIEAKRIPSRGHEYVANRLENVIGKPEANGELSERWINFLKRYVKNDPILEASKEKDVDDGVEEYPEDLGYEEL